MQPTSKPISKIGDILIQCGMVTPKELDEALVVAQKEHLRLGEALVKLGVLGEDQLVWALGVQFDLSHMDLTEELVDWERLNTLPVEQLHGLMVLPLTPEDGMQRVVIADPTVDGLKEFIEEMFPGRQVLVQLASAHDMDEMFEEVGRRRHRAIHPGTTGLWKAPPANALMRWIPRLESGRIERVVVVPSTRDDYTSSTFPWTAEGAERLSTSEMKSILDRLYDYFTCESPSSFVTSGLRSVTRQGETNAIRALALGGLTGHLLALEGITSTPPRKSRRRVTVLESKDPISLKSTLLSEAVTLMRNESSTPFLIVSLEAHLDFLAAGVFQAELCESDVRMGVCRHVITAARPNVLILELNSEEELRALPVEAASALVGRFFVLLRGIQRKEPAIESFDGLDHLPISPDPTTIRDQVQALLRPPGQE